MVEAEDLLKVILVLVIIWIGLEIIGAFFAVIGELLGPFDTIFGLLVVLLIVLFLLDRI